MKKIILLILLMTAFDLSGIAQTGIYSGGFGSRELRKTGWVIRPEVGVVGVPGYAMSLVIRANIGCQITPHIYFGGGIDCCVNPFKKGYDVYTGTLGYDNMESLFASFRWYWLDRKSSPFLELNAGIERYDCYTYDYYHEYYDYHSYDYYSYYGFSACGSFPYLNIAIGYDLRSFDIKLGVFNDYSRRSYFYHYSSERSALVPYLTIGYVFMIKE